MTPLFYRCDEVYEKLSKLAQTDLFHQWHAVCISFDIMKHLTNTFCRWVVLFALILTACEDAASNEALDTTGQYFCSFPDEESCEMLGDAGTVPEAAYADDASDSENGIGVGESSDNCTIEMCGEEPSEIPLCPSGDDASVQCKQDIFDDCVWHYVCDEASS